MNKIKVFIIMHDRLTIPQKLVKDLEDRKCEPILIDNGSSYPPLLEWYDNCSYVVHKFKGGRYTERIFWDSGLFDNYDDEYYIVTDHDLDISNVPVDYTDKLIEGLQNQNITKCGLSLEIDDLPENEYTKQIIGFESQYWKNKDSIGNYIAGVDTTLAMYDRKRQPVGWNSGDNFYYATRLPKPYTAKHLPWYLTENSLSLDEEERYYITKSVNFWPTVYKRTFNIGR